MCIFTLSRMSRKEEEEEEQEEGLLTVDALLHACGHKEAQTPDHRGSRSPRGVRPNHLPTLQKCRAPRGELPPSGFLKQPRGRNLRRTEASGSQADLFVPLAQRRDRDPLSSMPLRLEGKGSCT